MVGTIVQSKYSWAVALTLSLCKEIRDFRNVAHEAAEVEGGIELKGVLALLQGKPAAGFHDLGLRSLAGIGCWLFDRPQVCTVEARS